VGDFCVLSILFPQLVAWSTTGCNEDLVVVLEDLVMRLWVTVRFNLGTAWGGAFAMIELFWGV
jgi:hypothetical protein